MKDYLIAASGLVSLIISMIFVISVIMGMAGVLMAAFFYGCMWMLGYTK